MVIQFSHNGEQLHISSKSKNNGQIYEFDKGSTTDGIRFWNRENNHKRKFIKNYGWYLENLDNISFNPIPKEGELYFWGEWEPQSRFQLMNNKFPDKSLPNATHSPIISDDKIGWHNTDPFVFGDNFYYTNCKQKEKGRGKILLELPQNTVIIFGSELGNNFIMDTVFVVDTSEKKSSYNKSNYPDILQKITLDLNNGLENWKTLYKGKMYDFNINSTEKAFQTPFCFFPCKVGNNGVDGFPRPILDYTLFNLQKPGAGMVLKEITYKGGASSIWKDIVSLLISEGYSLGIKTVIPNFENTVIENSIKNSLKNTSSC